MAVTLLTRRELKERGVPFANARLLEMEYAGQFPRRIRLSTNTVRWAAEEVEEWIESRMAARLADRHAEQQAA